MAEMKIFAKIESFIHVLKCISAKIAETVRGSIHKSGIGFSIRNKILIYRDLSILNPISHINMD